MTKQRVIELIRVSTKQQAGDDRASIPAQKAVCKKIAAQYKLSIDWTVQMEDVSGASVLYAPEMQRMIELVKSGQAHGIITREWSRLMRPENYGDYGLLQLLAENKIVVYLPDGPQDLSTSSGAFMGQIQLAVAGLERRQIRDRMMSSREQMRREGRNCSAPNTWPFGVAWSKERGWYWTSDIEKVVRLFELFTAGTTSYSDLTRLTGISYYNIANILKNPVYTGWRVFDTRRDGSQGGKVMDGFGRIRYTKKIKRAAEDVLRIRIFDKGIVSDDTWARAQQMLTSKQDMHRRGARREQTDRFIYRGFLKCGACRMTIHSDARVADGSADYYVCVGRKGLKSVFRPTNMGDGWKITPGTCGNTYMRRDRLEPVINDVLSERLANPEFLDRLLDQHEGASKTNDNQQRIDRVRRELGSVEERRERLADLYIDGKLSKEQHAQRLVKLDQDHKTAKKALAELQRDAMPTGVSSEELASLLAPFAEWDILNLAQKRQLLSAAVPAINIFDYKVQGVYLALAGEHDGYDDDTPKGSGLSRAAKVPAYPPAATPSLGHEHYENRRKMASLIHMPVYLPLSIAV